MTRRSEILAALCFVALASVPTSAEQRLSATSKGSLLVYPKIELRWAADGALKQDVFLTLCNDFPADVGVELFLISETCTHVDNTFVLTKNQPVYWSALTGRPKGISPWTILGEPYADPEGTDDRVMRGHVLVWAVDEEYVQIRWNHLHGGATTVDYYNGTAWEYNAYAFHVVDENVANGDPVGEPGVIRLDGQEYGAGFDYLLADFVAAYSTAFARDPNNRDDDGFIQHDTALTLVVLANDLRQDANGPFHTKARFEVWNMNEVGLSEQHLCVTKWSNNLLRDLGGHFLVWNLQTDMGRLRVRGVRSAHCTDSTDQSLVGVVAKQLDFFNYGRRVTSGSNMFGAGHRAATIRYDVPDKPPERALWPVGEW